MKINRRKPQLWHIFLHSMQLLISFNRRCQCVEAQVLLVNHDLLFHEIFYLLSDFEKSPATIGGFRGHDYLQQLMPKERWRVILLHWKISYHRLQCCLYLPRIGSKDVIKFHHLLHCHNPRILVRRWSRKWYRNLFTKWYYLWSISICIRLFVCNLHQTNFASGG